MSAAESSSLREQEHPCCIACGLQHPSGLRMQFSAVDDGGVTATVNCGDAFQGYTGLMHGGIISLMLDAAMTNCLFQRGVAAFTARLNVRFLEPVRISDSVEVSAHVVRDAGSAFTLEGQVRQNDRVVAKGDAVFMRKQTAVREEKP